LDGPLAIVVSLDRSSGGQDRGAAGGEAVHGRCTDAPGATRDQHSFAGKVQTFIGSLLCVH
jgi:hypothetical protein